MRLCERYRDRTVLTRFVPDPAEPGQWARYYGRRHTTRQPPDASRDIMLRPPEGAHVITLPTFSKWGPEPARIVLDAPLVMGGSPRPAACCPPRWARRTRAAR